ncbi:hypothetical protein BLA24_10720 [Streptomyces cinnamoneus]|uniref:Uncharacterized protein n=1 Tax=Streptomyces cinnamoneus TaxID=53446 RepID=A0A2G1XL00_STRCJ|nr:hypothetical protein BLA24_10720 [Streptomyces cinnamoneus]
MRIQALSDLPLSAVRRGRPGSSRGCALRVSGAGASPRTGFEDHGAVGECIADAPICMLERLGIRRDLLLPGRLVPAEPTVRRLLARDPRRPLALLRFT